jgi:hypothetical protein
VLELISHYSELDARMNTVIVTPSSGPEDGFNGLVLPDYKSHATRLALLSESRLLPKTLENFAPLVLSISEEIKNNPELRKHSVASLLEEKMRKQMELKGTEEAGRDFNYSYFELAVATVMLADAAACLDADRYPLDSDRYRICSEALHEADTALLRFLQRREAGDTMGNRVEENLDCPPLIEAFKLLCANKTFKSFGYNQLAIRVSLESIGERLSEISGQQVMEDVGIKHHLEMSRRELALIVAKNLHSPWAHRSSPEFSMGTAGSSLSLRGLTPLHRNSKGDPGNRFELDWWATDGLKVKNCDRCSDAGDQRFDFPFGPLDSYQLFHSDKYLVIAGKFEHGSHAIQVIELACPDLPKLVNCQDSITHIDLFHDAQERSLIAVQPKHLVYISLKTGDVFDIEPKSGRTINCESVSLIHGGEILSFSSSDPDIQDSLCFHLYVTGTGEEIAKAAIHRALDTHAGFSTSTSLCSSDTGNLFFATEEIVEPFPFGAPEDCQERNVIRRIIHDPLLPLLKWGGIISPQSEPQSSALVPAFRYGVVDILGQMTSERYEKGLYQFLLDKGYGDKNLPADLVIAVVESCLDDGSKAVRDANLPSCKGVFDSEVAALRGAMSCFDAAVITFYRYLTEIDPKAGSFDRKAVLEGTRKDFAPPNDTFPKLLSVLNTTTELIKEYEGENSIALRGMIDTLKGLERELSEIAGNCGYHPLASFPTEDVFRGPKGKRGMVRDLLTTSQPGQRGRIIEALLASGIATKEEISEVLRRPDPLGDEVGLLEKLRIGLLLNNVRMTNGAK